MAGVETVVSALTLAGLAKDTAFLVSKACQAHKSAKTLYAKVQFLECLLKRIAIKLDQRRRHNISTEHDVPLDRNIKASLERCNVSLESLYLMFKTLIKDQDEVGFFRQLFQRFKFATQERNIAALYQDVDQQVGLVLLAMQCFWFKDQIELRAQSAGQPQQPSQIDCEEALQQLCELQESRLSETGQTSSNAPDTVLPSEGAGIVIHGERVEGDHSEPSAPLSVEQQIRDVISFGHNLGSTLAFDVEGLQLASNFYRETAERAAEIAEGWTPLHYAVSEPNEDMVRRYLYFLEHSCTEDERLRILNSQTKFGETAFMLAIQRLHRKEGYKIAKMLAEESGCDIQAGDKMGTPLFHAVKDGVARGDRLTMVKILASKTEPNVIEDLCRRLESESAHYDCLQPKKPNEAQRRPSVSSILHLGREKDARNRRASTTDLPQSPPGGRLSPPSSTRKRRASTSARTSRFYGLWSSLLRSTVRLESNH